MKATELLALGIGNILWADEGFGVRCVEAMNAADQFGNDMVLMDTGTQGLYLLPRLECTPADRIRCRGLRQAAGRDGGCAVTDHVA